MSWSTSDLAAIADTTIKTIRYYHEVGLLPEPDRASNGYKKYQVEHLVTLLRILRLRDLGFAVQDMGHVLESDDDAWAALKALDADIGERIKTLTAVREEIATLLRKPAADRPIVDLPVGMLGLTDDVNDADRAMLLVYSQLFDQETMEDIAETLRDRTKSPEEVEFDTLPPDADQATRQHLAEKLVPTFIEAAGMADPQGLPEPHLSRDRATAEDVLGATLSQLYNQAQVDVLRRVSALVTSEEEHPRR